MQPGELWGYGDAAVGNGACGWAGRCDEGSLLRVAGEPELAPRTSSELFRRDLAFAIQSPAARRSYCT